MSGGGEDSHRLDASYEFPDAVDELIARTRITEAIYKRSRGTDRNDVTYKRDVAYHPDAIDDHGFGAEPVGQFLGRSAEQHRNTRHAMHSVTNIVIEFLSATVAFVESHVIANEWQGPDFDFALRNVAATGAAGARIISWCRYADTFECRNGDWRITERTVIFGDMISQPLDAAPVLPPAFQVQRHGPDDPLYDCRARAVEHERQLRAALP
jgi:SnoaL-like domain